MKFKYLCEFKVTGMGQFPYDMLRYDHCWPATESHDSAGLMTPTMDRADEYFALRTVTLRRHTQGKGTNYHDTPQCDRWRSFGWVVSAVTWEKLL